MQRIIIKKNELGKFIDILKVYFDKLKKSSNVRKLSFSKFKKYFCNDNLFINTIGWINDYLCKTSKCKKINQLKKIYESISSSSIDFYLKIRNFIIENFTKKIKFCPYCGKVPLIYFEKWNWKSNSYRRMFQLDHFFPKNSYHKWIINFYNLIPSCNACNHLKLNNNPLDILERWWKIFHPYFWWIYKDWDKIKVDDSTFDEKVTFVWTPNLDYDSRTQIFSTYHWKFFRLWEIYLYDEETYNIFNFIYDKYTKIKDEYCRFKQTSKSIKEFIDYFFKNYYPEKEEEILKYSNWKFKKDLIEYMEKILEDDLEKKNKNKNYNLAWY